MSGVSMYKLSKIISDLQKYKKANGDLYVRGFKLSDTEMTQEFWMNSPIRKTKTGNRAKATVKEFQKMVKELNNES